MTFAELADEIKTHYPAAAPYATRIAVTAFLRWPKNPRLFAWLTVAIIERETNFKNVKGADGHGSGLMQIDDRAWKDWCAHHNAFDPEENIPEGELILTIGFKWFPKDPRAAIAAYNCGPGNVQRGLRDGKDPDLYTTGHDYGKDVLRRLDRMKPNDLVVDFAA